MQCVKWDSRWLDASFFITVILSADNSMSLLLNPVHLHAPPLHSTAPLLLHPSLVLCVSLVWLHIFLSLYELPLTVSCHLYGHFV